MVNKMNIAHHNSSIYKRFVNTQFLSTRKINLIFSCLGRFLYNYGIPYSFLTDNITFFIIKTNIKQKSLVKR